MFGGGQPGFLGLQHGAFGELDRVEPRLGDDRGQFVTPRLQSLLEGRAIKYDLIARAESASPATGSHKAHVMELQQILGKAFGR